jgi:hypothetical protein
MEIVKKNLRSPTVTVLIDSTHLSTPRVQNTQNSRFADLWLRTYTIFKSSILYNYFKMMPTIDMPDYWYIDLTMIKNTKWKLSFIVQWFWSFIYFWVHAKLSFFGSLFSNIYYAKKKKFYRICLKLVHRVNKKEILK